MNLNENFNQTEFIEWVEGFLPEFNLDIRKVDVPQSFSDVLTISTLGESSIGVRVYIIETDADPSRRKVGLATDSFSLLKNYASPNAIIAYYSKDSSLWRISLLTSTPIWSEGKIITKLSNPKRQSYVLGKNAKVKTPYQYLLSKGKVADFNDLKTRFSLEIVNKEFYKEISLAFTQLVGGTVTSGRSKKSYEAQLKLPYIKNHSQTSLEFSVRLIGRIIFCWFLREKRSNAGHSLMPKELLSYDATKTIEDYYHKILEPIFFEILNKPANSRKPDFINELFSAIPYLNGGLFSPHDDFFNYNEGKQAINHNLVVIPDKWLQSFFEVLETYNFTIDENTSFDEELSIDPEMLGRIFENLLAEINPETGESARKSTGSYYTPRVIVDYMIDESLFLYLKEKTNIEEVKLRSLISHDLDDDISNPLTDDQKIKITEALGKIKILDPACGSGAFPIGALQKIVFILQQIDQTGQLWFKKQIENTPIELRKVIEREFKEKNFDYIRKLGIIRENIYGVDIQPIATEISRLRCFLTLVVDERIDDSLENRGIEPLPNLDFKFVTANTLVGLPTSKSNGAIIQVGLFEDNEGINELKEVRDMFFTASGFDRDQLKLQFSQTQNKMLHKLIDESRRGHADMTSKLTSWDPFSHEASSWFDPEWMFGIKEGFDIVIANPPYVKEYTNKAAFDLIRGSNYYKGKMDLWYFFACVCIDLLKEQGVLSFIAQNNWTTSFGASVLRKKVIQDTQIAELIDFGEYKIFDSAGIQTMLMFFKKSTSHEEYEFKYRKVKGSDLTFKDILCVLNTDKSTKHIFLTPSIKRKLMESEKLLFSDQKTEILLSKIKNKSNFQLTQKEVAQGIVCPQDYVNKASQRKLGDSIKVGDGIFLLSNNELENLKLDINELKIVKPAYSTKELAKWYKKNGLNNEWVIYTDSSFKNSEKIKKYPNLKAHLDQFSSVITSDNKPYGLHRSRNEDFFTGEKIVVARKCAHPIFTYADFDAYVSATFYVIKSTRVNQKFLVGLLNSKLITFWLKNKGKMQGNNYQIDKEPLVDLPLIAPDKDKQLKVADLVDQIILLVKSNDYDPNNPPQEQLNIEDEINKLIYTYYCLENEEITSIENAL